MESCTGGGLAHILTSIPGAGNVYQGGFVTYSGFRKTYAGVPSDVLSGPDGPYSADVAEKMAIASLRDPFQPLPQNGSTIGVGITGTLDNVDRFYPHIAPGSVWIGIYHDNQTDRYLVSIPRRNRTHMKNAIIRETLDLVTQTIEQKPILNTRRRRAV